MIQQHNTLKTFKENTIIGFNLKNEDYLELIDSEAPKPFAVIHRRGVVKVYFALDGIFKTSNAIEKKNQLIRRFEKVHNAESYEIGSNFLSLELLDDIILKDGVYIHTEILKTSNFYYLDKYSEEGTKQIDFRVSKSMMKKENEKFKNLKDKNYNFFMIATKGAFGLLVDKRRVGQYHSQFTVQEIMNLTKDYHHVAKDKSSVKSACKSIFKNFEERNFKIRKDSIRSRAEHAKYINKKRFEETSKKILTEIQESTNIAYISRKLGVARETIYKVIRFFFFSVTSWRKSFTINSFLYVVGLGSMANSTQGKPLLPTGLDTCLNRLAKLEKKLKIDFGFLRNLKQVSLHFESFDDFNHFRQNNRDFLTQSVGA